MFLKPIWKCAFLAVLICGQAVLAAGRWDNILPNPGFEDVGDSGWVAGGWSHPNPVWRVDDTVAHSGKRSLTLANTDPKLYVFPQVTIPCEPGLSYDISGWVKTEDVKNVGDEEGSSLGATLCIQWMDEGGKWLGGFYQVQGLLGTHDWQRVSADDVPIPKEAKKVTFTVYMRQGLTGQAWFDDVSVKRHQRPLLTTFLARPNYRGIFFNPADGKLLLTLDLEDYDLTPDSVIIKIGDEKGKWSQEVAARAGEVPVTFSSNELPDGKSELVVTVLRKDNGEVLATARHRVEKRSPPAIPGAAWIDERNTLIVDGKPFFPLGWYMHEGVARPENIKDLETIGDSPFNCVMNYGITFPPLDKIRAYMDKAQQLGVKVIFSIKDIYEGSTYNPRKAAGFEGEENIVRGLVQNFGTHPALLAWYLNDELPTSYLPRLRARYQLMCEIEPNHPAWIVHYYSQEKLLAQYADTTDAMGVDPYPVPRQPVTYVARHTDAAVAAVAGARPVWVVPQAFAWYVYSKDVRAGKRPPNEKELKEGREPTMDEIRCMSYLALIHGAKGIVYYAFGDFKKSPNVEARWAAMKEIGAEMKKLGDIILLGERITPSPVTCDQKAVDLAVWRLDGVLYVLATNTSNAPCKVTFTIPPSLLPQINRIERFNASGEVQPSGGSFTEELAPFVCRAYAVK